MFCTSPITIYKRGEPGVLNPHSGVVERPVVACGHCKTCIASRKNDWSGRLIAEARKATEVYFLTLTYREEPTEFRYSDVQRALYKMRTDMARHHGGARVRFFCVGERGNKFGRIHWHLLIFLDGKHDGRMFQTWNKWNKPRQLWPWWSHGWTDCAPVPAADTIKRVRYCSKYAVKELGSDKSCRLRCSLKPSIGAEYIAEWAVDLAVAGLPLRGWYPLPGMVWERGHRKGQHVKYRLQGASARLACKVYADAWIEKHPRRPWSSTSFLQRYHPCEMMTRFAQWGRTSDPLGEGSPGVRGSRADPELPGVQITGVAHGKLFVRDREWVMRANADAERWGGMSVEEIEKAQQELIDRSEQFAASFRACYRGDGGAAFRRAQCERLGVASDFGAGAFYVRWSRVAGEASPEADLLRQAVWQEGNGADVRPETGYIVQSPVGPDTALGGSPLVELLRLCGGSLELTNPETGEIRFPRTIAEARQFFGQGFCAGSAVEVGSGAASRSTDGECDVEPTAYFGPRAGGLASRAVRHSVGSNKDRGAVKAAAEKGNR